MGSQAVAAIIAFAAGVIVTTLGGWFSRQLERRKHLAQLTSVAFVDWADSVCEDLMCEAALASLGDQASEDEKRYWRRRLFEARAAAYSAKARLAAFGSGEVNRFIASIERRGGISGSDPITRQLSIQMVRSFREELGFKKDDVSEQDLGAVLFGPTDAERESPPGDGMRGWPTYST
jgi:hypothetical protein